MDTRFPNIEDHQALRQLLLSSMSDDQSWRWFSYAYGFRRVALQTRDDVLPIDPLKKWFDPDLAAQAEAFWARTMGRRAPPLPEPRRPDPTAEEIAHVEECCRQIRANLGRFLERSTEVFRPAAHWKQVEGPPQERKRDG
jgi:hypothetical protein